MENVIVHCRPVRQNIFMDFVQDMINDFHLPSAKRKLFQKGIFNSGIKTYSHFPKTIKELSHDVKQFRLATKRFIVSNSFYSLESILTLTGNE